MFRNSKANSPQRSSLILVIAVLLFVPFCLMMARRARSAPAATASFSWKMRERFGNPGADGLTEYHWNSEKESYADEYVHPKAWTVDFDGCANLPPQAVSKWEFDGQAVNETTCSLSRDFSALGPHSVRLTVSTPDGQSSTVQSNIILRDYFIVSIGDSFASGEGTPDKQRGDPGGVRWVDRRCHRSAMAGPARAAAVIEKADPHSSVTFISFACSGAGIEAGLLGGQKKGSRLVKPQLDKIFQTAGDRPIDAVLMSIGGNDVSFDDLVKKAIRLNHADTDVATNKLFMDGLQDLPRRFASLAQRLTDPGNKAGIGRVFITEYPDLVRDETRDFCDHSVSLLDLLRRISGAESEWALNKVIIPLNAELKTQATSFGWVYVDGILSEFGDDSKGHLAHGFCADDKRWVNTFRDSLRIQGDFNGTVHPNADGYVLYASRLVEQLRANGVITMSP
jgi:lysophospholipase L1-like esterase